MYIVVFAPVCAYYVCLCKCRSLRKEVLGASAMGLGFRGSLGQADETAARSCHPPNRGGLACYSVTCVWCSIAV